jgi:hypothetical protein
VTRETGPTTDAEGSTDTHSGAAADPGRPLLRVVKGDPGDEELAALVAVVAATAAARVASPGPAPRSQWSAPGRGHRPPLAPGRGGWRASALPR